MSGKQVRIGCLVPGCRRTCAAIADAEEEYICPSHMRQVLPGTYREYEAAWDAATALDKAMAKGAAVADLTPYVRVSAAFDRCKEELGLE